MSKRGITVPVLFLPVVMLLILSSSVVVVDAQAQDAPILWTADDPQLEWGPCTDVADFLPEGCVAAVLQGNPAERNADVFMRIPQDTPVAHHWHTSAERMVLISGEFHVDFDGHDPVVMRPGTYAYGPARLPHDAYCAPGDDCILFIAFEEPVDAVPTGQ